MLGPEVMRIGGVYLEIGLVDEIAMKRSYNDTNKPWSTMEQPPNTSA
jgi:hypothetical protein